MVLKYEARHSLEGTTQKQTATMPTHHNPEVSDHQHQNSSNWGDSAEQLWQSRLRQLDQMQLDDYSDQDKLVGFDTRLGPRRSGVNTAPLGARRHVMEPLSQHASGPASEILTLQQQPLVQQREFEDTEINTLSPSQANQHPRVKKRGWSGGSTHAQRLQAWMAGPKELSQEELSELKQKAETDRSSLTRSERQKLRKHLDLQAGSKWDLTPGRKAFKKQKSQQLQQQLSKPHEPRQRKLPDTLASPSQFYSKYPSFHHPPSHSETTPPPAPTFKPSSTTIATGALQAVRTHSHSLSTLDTISTSNAINNHAAAPICQSCNANLAEIERTTPFRYPTACPLCHTPRAYLLGSNIPPPTPKATLQHTKRTQKRRPGSLIPPLAGRDYVPVAVLSEDQNSNAVGDVRDARKAYVPSQVDRNERNKRSFLQEAVGVDGNGKRAKLDPEHIRHGESKAERVEREHLEDRVSVFEMVDNREQGGEYERESFRNEDDVDYDDEATVDEEEWEQGRVKREWQEACEEDEEVAIRSEDEV